MYEEPLRAVLDMLQQHDVPYMITGSFASNVYGTPRTTHDADIVIRVHKPSDVSGLLRALQNDFYVNAEAARNAVAHHRIFNAIHFDTSFKVDFIVNKPRPYSRTEFKRRQRHDFLGLEVWFASPEDVILSKLEWAKDTTGNQQYRDALNVARVQGDSLDTGYINKWAKELGVVLEADEILQAAVDER